MYTEKYKNSNKKKIGNLILLEERKYKIKRKLYFYCTII